MVEVGSASGWVIYQPIIVGLGVVALGFLANALLEIWKERIRRHRIEREFRKAVYFESLVLAEWTSSAINVLEGKPTGIAIRRSKLLSELDPVSVSNLNRDEIIKLQKFLVDYEFVFAWVFAGDFTNYDTSIYFLEETKNNFGRIDEMLRKLHNSAEDISSMLHSKI